LTCDEATNGSEAYEKYKLHLKRKCCSSYKLIFMDLQIPVMDGVEATIKITQIQKQKGIKNLHILAVTAYSSEDEDKKCKAIGMTQVLKKPVNATQINDCLRKYLT
jgi:CheY-like chemotaxis protein